MKGQNGGLAYIIKDEICLHKIADYDWWWLCSNKGNYYKLFILSCLFRTNFDFTNFLKVEIGEMLVKD